MAEDVSNLIVSVVSAISGSVAAVVAGIALKYNAKSFDKFSKAEDSREKSEELRFLEGIYRDISRGLKEYNLLKAQIPSDGKLKRTVEEEVSLKKLDVLLDEFFADVNWLCFLFLHDRIKDQTLVDAFKDQILYWYHLFEEQRPHKVGIRHVYPDFQNFYRKYKK